MKQFTAWRINILLYVAFIGVGMGQLVGYAGTGFFHLRELDWLVVPIGGLIYDTVVLFFLLNRKAWVRVLIRIEMVFAIFWLTAIALIFYPALFSAYAMFYLGVAALVPFRFRFVFLVPAVLSFLNLVYLSPKLREPEAAPLTFPFKKVMAGVGLCALASTAGIVYAGVVPHAFSECLTVQRKALKPSRWVMAEIDLGTKDHCSYSAGDETYARVKEGHSYTASGERAPLNCVVQDIGEECAP